MRILDLKLISVIGQQDFGPQDRDGNLRPLHIDRALDVADLKEAPAPRQPLRVLRYRRGCAGGAPGSCAAATSRRSAY